MRNQLRLKLTIICIVVLVFVSIGLFPLASAHMHFPLPGWLMDKQLKLGLDLKGGVQLVVRVQTDEALRTETNQTAERLREALRARNVSATVNSTSIASFVVGGVVANEEAAVREVLTDSSSSFDVIPSVNGYTVTMKPNIQNSLRAESIVQARQTIERRVNELGVAEPTIAIQGRFGDQILIQLPGVTEIDHAKTILRSPGVLALKLVDGGPADSPAALTTNGFLPEGTEVIPGVADASDRQTVYYRVRRLAVVDGRDVRNARPSVDENNLPAVAFSLTNDGAHRFGSATEANIGRQLAIILDGRVVSAPRIDNRITTDGSIHGSFTQQEANDLALVLRSGSLGAPLSYIQESTIGPTLGADSIRSGVIASAIGLTTIVVFMLVYYRLSGVNAAVALVINLLILLGLMAYIGAVMTLPGIAGFVLTMGIGVDSNVLIFERIKEELQAQHGVRAAINTGFGRVFLTLLDTHISALIAAAFLFQFGTGPIRGFAVTLSIGLVSNLFTSTFVSKTLFELVVTRRRDLRTLSI